MKEYEVRIYVSGLNDTDEEYPDSGDFEGSAEWNDEYGCAVFDGTYTVVIKANSEKEAKELAKEMYEKADSGVLTDCFMGDTDILSVRDIEQNIDKIEQALNFYISMSCFDSFTGEDIPVHLIKDKEERNGCIACIEFLKFMHGENEDSLKMTKKEIAENFDSIINKIKLHLKEIGENDYNNRVVADEKEWLESFSSARELLTATDKNKKREIERE